MPQKYLPTFSDKRYFVGFEALKDRPKLASVIGECISTWSYVDNEIGGLFGVLMTTDSPAAHRVFVILRRSANQLEALAVGAEGKLSSNEMVVYKALITEYGELEAERNRLAHSCFGTCPDDENLLFTINVKHHVLWQAEVLPKLSKGDCSGDSHAGLKEQMYVYRLSDLETIHRRMEQLWWDMFYFNGYLREPTNPGRVAEFKRLLSKHGSGT